MYDLEKIGKITADLDRYFADLDKLKVESPPMSKQGFYSLSMILFAILNRAIDLGQEIVRGRALGMPTSYKEIFQLLEKEKIISKQISLDLQYLAARRNVLAHEYFDVTEQSIFAIYLKIKVVQEFRKNITLFLSGKKK